MCVKFTFNTFIVLKSKVERPITTSASACRALWLKSKLMGIDMEKSSKESIEEQIKALHDIPKKWNISPEFRLI